MHPVEKMKGLKAGAEVLTLEIRDTLLSLCSGARGSPGREHGLEAGDSAQDGDLCPGAHRPPTAHLTSTPYVSSLLKSWALYIHSHHRELIKYCFQCGCVRAKSLQLCLTPCDPMDGSTPGRSVSGILQARILEWVAISFSRGSSQPRDLLYLPALAGRGFTTRTTWEAHCYHCCLWNLNSWASLWSPGLFSMISYYQHPHSVLPPCPVLSECGPGSATGVPVGYSRHAKAQALPYS